MKNAFTIFFFLVIMNAAGQQPVALRTGYISQVPFFVEADLVGSESVDYFPDGRIEITIPILSSRFKVGIPLGSVSYSVIHRIDYRPDQKKRPLQEIAYKVEGPGHENSSWNKLPVEPAANDHLYLLDISSGKIGDSLRILFKDRKGIIFQSVQFLKSGLLPTIRLFRAVDRKDTTVHSLRSHIVKQNSFTENFRDPKGKSFEIKAGQFLELVFADQSVNLDSGILYRLNSDNKTGSWQRTGHFTLLKDLKSNKKYTLEVQYAGSNLSNTYELKISPKWYQLPMVLFGLTAILLSFCVAAGFIWLRLRLIRERRKKEQLLYRLKGIQAQLNPHFIFNALSSIQALVNTDRKKEANEYLTNFSSVLRGALKNSDSAFITLFSELEFLKSYLNIEQLRFQFSYELKVDSSLALNEIEVPPMLFQPVIENAIRHGVSTKGKEGLIILTIAREGNGFGVRVFDNAKWRESLEEGYGISLTKKRVTAANELRKGDGINFFIDKSEAGTTVHFKFKNWFL